MNYLPELDIFGNIVTEIKTTKQNKKHKKHARKLKKTLDKVILIEGGKECHKCGLKMHRRKHKETPLKFHYTQWDVCDCGVVKHYEEFKSADWKEYERQQEFISSI